jgi:hypothetical protein
MAALASWLGFVVLGLEYDASRPTVKGPDVGRIYPFVNHTHVVYLTAMENFCLDALAGAAALLLATGVTLDFIQRKRTGRDAWTET